MSNNTCLVCGFYSCTCNKQQANQQSLAGMQNQLSTGLYSYPSYTSSAIYIMSDVDLIAELKRRNLIDAKTIDKLVLDAKIHRLQDEAKKIEIEIAAAIAEKLKS